MSFGVQEEMKDAQPVLIHTVIIRKQHSDTLPAQYVVQLTGQWISDIRNSAGVLLSIYIVYKAVYYYSSDSLRTHAKFGDAVIVTLGVV